ncbi:hypothetical protein M9H61_11665 [Thalassospira sp. GO-4]|jgi:putative ABC transport system permease protein|uniref:ABC transporter permease n=1 Tax=Thalassospira sp. GO-4 TaxID=2946605 RepID=UPI002023EC0C|nr:FtsX-like permease family protein [Thalassospira sp. GO-4]URK16208.1 hypothetical protein M9H61_11665 [Thalassospira sp. GO-4]
MSRLPSSSFRSAACKAIGRFVHCQLRRPTAGIWALFATLVFAITTLSLTVSMTHSVRDALRQSAEQTIGGDISLRLFHRPPTDAELGFLETFGIVGVSAEQRVMIHPKPDQPGILSELKAVDRTYPLFGDVKLSRPGPVSAILANDDDDHAGGNKNLPGAIVDQDFLDQSGLSIGDVIHLGDQQYRIRAGLLAEPERQFRLFSLGPRIIVSLDDYRKNALLSSDKQVYWYSRLERSQADPRPNSQVIADIEARFPESGWRIVNAADGIPGIERIGEFATAFVSLIGIAIFAISMSAIANAIRSDLNGRQDQFALMRAVGVRPGQLGITIAGLVGGISVVALIVSAFITQLLAGMIAPIFASNLGVTLNPSVHQWTDITGFVACFVALLSIGPIHAACAVKPALLFRHQTDKTPHGSGTQHSGVWLLRAAILTSAIAVIWFAMRLIGPGWFSGILIAVLVLCLSGFIGVGFLVRKVSALAAHRCAGSPALKLALRNIARPTSPTVTVAASFGLAVTCLFAVIVFGALAGHHLRSVLPTETPDLVFFDLPPDQQATFRTAALAVPSVEAIEQMPFVHGRVTHLNGKPVVLDQVPRRYHWFIRGDRGLSWARHPNATLQKAELVAGDWWPGDSINANLVSLDADIARALGLGLGDSISVNILGQRHDVKIANLRKIDWSRLGLDFPMVLSPMQPPFTHGVITTIDLVPSSASRNTAAAISRLAAQFPAVPMIRVSDVMDRLGTLFDRVHGVLLLLTVLATVGALLVIVTGLIALRQDGAANLAMLRALGIRPGQIIRTGALETGIVVAASGVLGTVAGTSVAVLAASRIGSFDVAETAVMMAPLAAGAVALIGIIGFGGGWVLQQASLRAQSGWRRG